MSMRVATFAMSERLLTATMQTQVKFAEKTLQQASGLVSADYGGLGGDAKALINLEVSMKRSQGYIDASSDAGARIETMYDALGSMADLMTSFRADLASLSNGDADNAADLAELADGMLEEFAALLNTQYEGRYLFAGTATGTKPVDVTLLAAQTTPSTVDTSYYLGNGETVAVRVGTDQVVSYGITADDPAFETALRALQLVSGLTSAADPDATLDEASDLVVEALDGVISLQSRTSLKAGQLERAAAAQETFVATITNLADNINAVDVAAVAAEMTNYETQLQAAYAAIAKIQGLSLTDYLK